MNRHRLLVLLIFSLFLSGCPKKIQTHPVIDTRPPQYIWVCQTHKDGTIVCDAVSELKDVPLNSDCVYQDNGVTSCWLN